MRIKNLLFLFLLTCVTVMAATAQNSSNLYAKVKRLEGQGNGGNWLNMTEATRDSILAGAPWKVQTVEYEAGTTPVQVRVYNPVDLKDFDYRLKINPVINSLDSSLVDTSSHWVLEWYQNGTLMGSYTSHNSIGNGTEEFLEGHGIAITVKDQLFSVRDEGVKDYVDERGGATFQNNSWYSQLDLVGSIVKYGGGSHWLGGVRDADTHTPGNWIRAGNHKTANFWESNPVQNGAEDNYMLWRLEDFFNLYNSSYEYERGFMDYYGQYEHIADGTWAPYVMSSPYDGGPKARYITPDVDLQSFSPRPEYYNFTSLTSIINAGGYNQTLTNLYSVDIVLTPDQSKWTRALVLEAGAGTAENEYKVAQNFNGQTYYNIRHEPKNCPSVDKNGNPDNSGTTGFGWFPGYAINVETGERLNIMFAENSEDEYNHGNDMIFNPTNVYAFKKDTAGALILDANGQPIPMSRDEYDSLYLSIYEYGNPGNHPGEPLNGGRHYVYVCGSSGNTFNGFYRLSTAQRNFNDNNNTIAVTGQSYGGFFTDADSVSYPYYDCGVYDEGRWLKEKFNTFVNETNYAANVRKAKKMQLFNNVMWTGIPMPAVGEEQHWLDNEATVSIRVARPFMFYTSAVGTGPDVVTNNNAPVFTFNTQNISMAQNVELYQVEDDVQGLDNRIDANNVDAPVYPYSGGWFWNGRKADYHVPKGTPKTSYFSYSLWLGGLDDNDSLHVAAERFNQLGKDTWPGPLSRYDASVDNATMMKWNRTFKITRADVTECLANYQNPEYIIPQNVRDWPAHGDTLKGQAWNLAPFVDVDSNNVYEPEHGDYPDFPGDMAQFIVFNDNYAAHTESGGAPLGTETHVMVYAYDSPGDTIMNNTIFMKYKIFNRSQNNYHNTYIGLWSDWDLGYANDDYVGCDIMKNSAYCYNGTSIDGSGQEWAYGENWPVQTITLVSGPLMPADSLDNPAYTDSADCSLFINQGLNDYAVNGTGFGDGIADNERYGLTGFIYHNNNASITGDPQRAQDYYSLMTGHWKSVDTANFGPHLKYGSVGHLDYGSTDIDCRFMFYGNTDSRCHFATYGVEVPDSLYGAQGWTEMNTDYTVPYDRRGLASVGPFNLEAGDVQEFEICLTTIPHELAVTRGDVSLASLEDVNNQYRPQIFVPAVTFEQHENICEGQTYEFFGQICDTTGIYRHWIRNNDYDNYEADTVYLLYLTKEPLYTLYYAAVLPRHGYSGHGFNITSSQTGHIGTRMYTHSYTSANGCDSSVVLILEVRLDAGVEDFTPVESFRIYPNPTTEYVTIEVDDENLIQKKEPIMLFDLSGKLLQSKLLTNEKERIDLGGYPSGVYLIKIGRKVSKVIKK